MKTRRIHLRLRVPSRLRSDYRPSLQGIDTCRQLSALRAGMMITRSRWSTPTGSLSQNRSGNDVRKQMESPENSLSFRLDLKDCLNWSFNQCAQTTNTKPLSLSAWIPSCLYVCAKQSFINCCHKIQINLTILSLGKIQINLTLLSLIRIFVATEKK